MILRASPPAAGPPLPSAACWLAGLLVCWPWGHSKFCTVPMLFSQKMFKKQDGMLAFFGFPSSAQNDDFRCLEGTFRHLLAPWSTILLTWGAQGAPRKTPGCPDLDFFMFFVNFGDLLGLYF